ncbi:hypothetical protein J4E82_010783 [Alternaria postmessia]|uniref:uncharacterized protein n=1 Tax=Alternaria postmessia TaxID=1187938 RepID=UPI0022240D8B|nr:uncharacterized protein J4E82_010783 [Alternaria postmessia]KAI5368419.1 hypothetical protein J4E82_010783 [Alternaria postmessia]
MALSIIKQRIAYYGAGDLIAALPPHDLMEWVLHPAATPPKALVIGTCDGRDVLAFMKSFGGSPRRVQYCFKPTDRRLNASTAQSLAPDEVVKLPLNEPFRHSADTSELGKRNLGIVVQWYFVNMIEPEVDYVKYCPQLYNALQDIDARKRAEDESRTPRPEEPRGAQDQRLSYHSHPSTEGEVTRQLVAPGKSAEECPLASMNDDGPSDLETLHNYLGSHNVLYLLKNLPDADEFRFVHQDFLLDAQPRKLFVGYHKEHGNDIYAYMRKPREYHRIEFYIENSHALSKTVIRSEDVVRQRILHPFDKTCLEGAHKIGQDEKARLTLMVKWYFIAAGVAKDCVLRETKAFPERLRSALEYIAERMGAASARPPSIDCERQNEPTTTPEEARPAQFTTAEITTGLLSSPSTSTTASPRPSTAYAEQLNDQVNAVDTPISRLAKRTADDAEFEDLAGIVLEVLATDQNLKSQIDDIDKQIEVLQTERKDLVERRKHTKRRFTSQTLAIASKMDGKRHQDSV